MMNKKTKFFLIFNSLIVVSILLISLTIIFGENLKQRNQNYIVQILLFISGVTTYTSFEIFSRNIINTNKNEEDELKQKLEHYLLLTGYKNAIYEEIATSKKRAKILETQGLVQSIQMLSAALEQESNSELVTRFLIGQQYIETINKTNNRNELTFINNSLSRDFYDEWLSSNGHNESGDENLERTEINY